MSFLLSSSFSFITPFLKQIGDDIGIEKHRFSSIVGTKKHFLFFYLICIV